MFLKNFLNLNKQLKILIRYNYTDGNIYKLKEKGFFQDIFPENAS